MDFHFKTNDCPDANGRKPHYGEQKLVITFKVEGGDTLYVEIGDKGRDNLLEVLLKDKEAQSG